MMKIHYGMEREGEKMEVHLIDAGRRLFLFIPLGIMRRSRGEGVKGRMSMGGHAL